MQSSQQSSDLKQENGRITISNICGSSEHDHSHEHYHDSQLSSENKENQFPTAKIPQLLQVHDAHDDGISQASELFNQPNYYFLFDKQM